MGKLVLSVKEAGQTVVVPISDTEEVTVFVSKIKGKRVSLAIGAPRRCRIFHEQRPLDMVSDQLPERPQPTGG